MKIELIRCTAFQGINRKKSASTLYGQRFRGENKRRMKSWKICWSLVLAFASTGHVYGGGSGLNVVVVVNQSSSNSVELGNYYCEKRQVPPQNVLRTSWTGANDSWLEADFETVILNPLLSMISARGLTNQIDYVVVSMDFPFRITEATGYNSTTADLFYGFKPDGPAMPGLPASCNLPAVSDSSYAGSESIFRYSHPSTATTNSFLATMITSTSLDAAKAVVDHGLAGDGAFPTQTVILGESSDPFRNVRYLNFDDTIFSARLRTNYSILQTNLDSPLGLSNMLGYQNGHYQFAISPNAFVPGAMADSLTSYGGVIFGLNDHTTLLAFINASASGSYGTIVEPCNYLEKFPAPQNYFYQARGFSLAECYYQSVTNPYQGLLVAEPLSAPFAMRPIATWNNLQYNARLTGVTNLGLQIVGSDLQHPVQQVDLFLDGIFLQSVTNIAPTANNIIYVTINGFPTNYTIPASASIKSVTSNLTMRLSQAAYVNATKVHAFTHGDRIELQSFDNTKLGPQVSLSVSNSAGSAAALTTYLSTSRPNFLDSPARGSRSYSVTNIPQVGSFLELDVIKTNGQTVVVSLTNNTAGATIAQFAHAFFNSINTAPNLMGADGVSVENVVMHEDFSFAFGSDDHSGDFDIRPRSPGWPASQVKARMRAGLNLAVTPSTTNTLDVNVTDLQPRNHLYVTAGLTNLPLTAALNTTTLADGYHELTAVAYEGSHVRTQTRISQNIVIQNSSLSATLNLVAGGTNSFVGNTLQFSVVANTNNVSKIELFATGGSLGSVLGQSNALFNVPGTNVGVGLHPFYAIVTIATGKQYRTQTIWVRLFETEPPFPVSISVPPFKLTWPATPAKTYNILSTTNLTSPFQVRDSVTVSNSFGQWVEPNPTSMQRFYRLQTTN
jgi:uncharacterized protein (TIGR03790 family)